MRTNENSTVKRHMGLKARSRISNSVIINRRHLKEIIPSFSMKFRLRMSDGSIVEVTRSYYSSFKEAFRI